jgi:hypothetical protein
MSLSIIQTSHPQLQTAKLIPSSRVLEEGQHLRLANGQGLLYICVNKDKVIETFLRSTMHKPLFQRNANRGPKSTNYNFRITQPDVFGKDLARTHQAVLRIIGQPDDLRALSHDLTNLFAHAGQLTLRNNLALLIQRASVTFDPFDL